MSLLRLTNGFDEMSDPALEVRAAGILNAMTANASFATPTPSLEYVRTLLNDYSESLSVSLNGSNYDKALKNEKKQALVDVLHSLGYYVLFAANGNELIARSSGFSIAKGPSPRELTGFENLQLADGRNGGELELRFKRPEAAKSFIYWYAPEPLTPDTVWASQTGTRVKVVLTGLESGKRYHCKVTAIGANNQQVTSNPVSRIVQ